jgi:D-glucuronyl C5-epimerase C-terminus
MLMLLGLLAGGGALLAGGADAATSQGARPQRARGPAHRSQATLEILRGDGRTYPRSVPIALPESVARAGTEGFAQGALAPPRARAARAHGLTVLAGLIRLRLSGAITSALYNQYESDYVAAVNAVKRLHGTRHNELDAVLANVEAIAAQGGFTRSRLPVLFMTLARNREWWTTGPLLAADQRVSFPDSKLVWQYYPGQGIEIQWLGTFGEANGYYLSGHQDAALRELLEEAIPLATARAGGIAWEYLFRFDGGAPPWTSGLSQGTALQVLARAYIRFHDPLYLDSAERALGIFEKAPPAGVRLATNAGAWYVQYTFAPHDLILNGFIQALVGLYDYTELTRDPRGASLFEAGDAEARVEVPHYDTGAWSRYDQSSESSLSYHELLTEFLVHLCERTEDGPPLVVAGVGPTAPRNPIAGDQIYCTTASDFKADLHAPPRIALLTKRLPPRARGGVAISLSKISTVTLTVREGSRVIATNTALLESGSPRLLWITPSTPGSFAVSVRAVDLAGNSASATGTITVASGQSSAGGPRAR